MARIAYADLSTLPEKTRSQLEELAPLNIFRMMAHAGHLMGPFSRLGGAFLFKGLLDPVTREVAILRVGYLSNATYETAQHEAIGRNVGMSEELISQTKTGPHAEGLSDLHRLVLAFVDDVVANVRASDDTFTPIVDRLGPDGAQELTMLTGYYMMVCRFLETFGVGYRRRRRERRGDGSAAMKRARSWERALLLYSRANQSEPILHYCEKASLTLASTLSSSHLASFQHQYPTSFSEQPLGRFLPPLPHLSLHLH